MKHINPALQQHLKQECLTLAQCWKITRRDGVILGFTNHDVPLTVDNIIYHALSGFTPSAIASQSSLAVDNMDIEGILDHQSITENDVLAGIYDYAQIETFLVNYTDISQGIIQLRSGWLGEVHLNKHQFLVEVRGLTQQLAHHIGELYSPICRANLGDNRCRVDVSSISVTGSVSALINPSSFYDASRSESIGYFDGGNLRFTSGANQSISREIKFFQTQGKVSFNLPFPFPIAIGDAFIIAQGCNKTLHQCGQRFDNILNFRGEPHLPGLDKILQTSGTRQT